MKTLTRTIAEEIAKQYDLNSKPSPAVFRLQIPRSSNKLVIYKHPNDKTSQGQLDRYKQLEVEIDSSYSLDDIRAALGRIIPEEFIEQGDEHNDYYAFFTRVELEDGVVKILNSNW